MKETAPYILVVFVAALVLGFVGWREEHAQRLAAETTLEAERAKAAGLLEAERESGRQLSHDMLDLMSKNDDLQAQVKKVQEVVPSAKVERIIVSRSTGAAGGKPLPTASAGTLSCPPCLLFPGDPLEVKVTQLDMRSKLGNLSVVGEVEVNRGGAVPTTLLRAPFQASSSKAEELAPPAASRVPTMALRGGPRWTSWSLTPTGGWLGLDRRLWGRLWLTGEVTVDTSTPYVAAQIAQRQMPVRRSMLAVQIPAGTSINGAMNLGLRWEW